ncbi:hypothetical protein Asp14428_07160 [Actinoplanes sp. NBRC 14428]|nr:hypothetical protein Asp14428_07160 [Actinoplanes sp. NBRC 14428]
MTDHVRRSAPGETPYLRRFLAMTMDERWADRSPQTMLDTFHWYRGEAFDLIVEDLLALSPHRGVIAEGFRLLPELVAPLLATPGHALWLLPTPHFRRTALETRGDLWTIAGRTSHPARALLNLLERDALFTDRLAETTTRLALPHLHIDEAMTEDALEAEVTAALGL